MLNRKFCTGEVRCYFGVAEAEKTAVLSYSGRSKSILWVCADNDSKNAWKVKHTNAALTVDTSSPALFPHWLTFKRACGGQSLWRAFRVFDSLLAGHCRKT